ncbi:class I SAM-dependent methyltransferase [Nostoc sp. CHAB 5844]|nr:class I SAM-dependent methyltransferase [Nostoc sp. CHAB 5844]
MNDFEEQERLYENVIASRYNRDYHSYPIMKNHDRNFASFVAQYYRQGDRVLDLGCGPASLWHLWKELLPSPDFIIGVDISEGMISECQKMYPEDNYNFKVGSALDIPVESGSIDLVIVSSILHHIPDEYLPQVFQEMNRVLDEHGTIVGREPVSQGKLGDQPGWFSGALMSFRHLVYRLTHTREYPEPAIGSYHHAYVPMEFMQILKQFFSPKSLLFRHPISSLVSRCDYPLVEKIVYLLDKSLNHYGGHEFYYVATKNYTDAEDVAYCIQQELLTEFTADQKVEFMALLQKASEILEKELDKN